MGKRIVLFCKTIMLGSVLLISNHLMAGLTPPSLGSKLSVRFTNLSPNKFQLDVAQVAIVDNPAALLKMGFTNIKRGDRIKITYCDGTSENPALGPNTRVHFRIEFGSQSQKFEVDQNMNFARLK
jgi:hypothetical protein